MTCVTDDVLMKSLKALRDDRSAAELRFFKGIALKVAMNLNTIDPMALRASWREVRAALEATNELNEHRAEVLGIIKDRYDTFDLYEFNDDAPRTRFVRRKPPMDA